MMKITHQFHPFSHLPGIQALAPGSKYTAEVFPERLRMYTVSGEQIAEVHFLEVGPLKQFTVTQDLERGCIRISGMAQGGFFHYEVWGGTDGITLRKRKAPVDCLVSVAVTSPFRSSYNHGPFADLSIYQAGDLSQVVKARVPTRLCLGCYKKQEWEKVVCRRDMNEILPFWYFVAQPFSSSNNYEEGTLLYDLSCAIQEKDSPQIVPLLLDIFLTGFSGIFVPQIVDTHHLGYKKPSFTHGNRSPLDIFGVTLPLIRSLFFVEDTNSWNLLPLLPPQFHCGKLVIQAQKATLWIEWTKKCIRRLFIEMDEDCTIELNFPKQIRSFRHHPISQPKKASRLSNNSSLLLNGRTRYLCDQFET